MRVEPGDPPAAEPRARPRAGPQLPVGDERAADLGAEAGGEDEDGVTLGHGSTVVRAADGDGSGVGGRRVGCGDG